MTPQSAACQDRLDGLVTAFINRSDISAWLDILKPLGIRDKAEEMLAACFQYGYLAGHFDGMSHADKTVLRAIERHMREGT